MNINVKIFSKVLIILFIVSFVFGLAGPTPVFAAPTATAPDLGVATGYSVFGSAGVTDVGLSHAWGDVGENGAGDESMTGKTGGVLDAGANVPVRGAILSAYNQLKAQADATPGDILNLAVDNTVGPGIYNVQASAFTHTLTLNGAGVYIFSSTSSIAQTAGGTMVLGGGATACNVFWQIPATMTFAAAPAHIEGTIITNTEAITFVDGVSLKGRAWAYTAAVTLSNNQITEPTCAAAPILTLVKTITNDNGGARPLADFPLTATGPTNITGVSGSGTVTSATVTAGTYTLSETTHADYTAGLWTCTNGITVTSSQITLGSGQTTVCTIDNNDIAPQLHLRKLITLDNGGTATVADFTLTANGTGSNDISGTSPVDSGAGLLADTFALSETSPGGYTASAWVCVGGTQVGSNITVGINQSATCTITNDDIAPGTATLTLVKTITNDNGGARPLADFPLTATGSTTITGVSGAGAITGATVTAGTYTLSETTHADYTAGLWTCTNGITVTSSQITLGSGQTTVCTINNNDIAPVLHLRKTVVLDNGGSALNTAWTLTAIGALGSPTNLTGTTPVDSGGTFKADTYILGESGPAGYTASLYSCVKNGGGAVLSNSITLALGDTATCTITNDDIASGGGGSANGTINVVKIVINDSGGTKMVADFPLFVNGISVTSGVTKLFVTSSAYTVTETADSHYTRTFSGDCDVSGRLSLNAGDNKVCIVTNNDIGTPAVPIVPPLIDVVKIPSPLTLPGGPGPVTYTYTLKNIGTVPVTNVTTVGDTCSPINLVSGDTNVDAKLQVNETWIYTCSTTLTNTHTNTVTATGWANGLSAIDIANATVVVGAATIPPLIHVTKVPNPLTLRAGGGMVTYTNKVTNPGTVALSNVRLSDDKCSPVAYVSGDTNGNTLLDISETWTYTCQTRLTATMTNTVIASGDANGLTARDFAIATVIVASPRLPNTGFAPDSSNTPWNVIIPTGLFVVLFSLFLARKKLAI